MIILLNDEHYAAFIHVFHCITFPTDQVHMIEIWNMACGMSGKSRRRSWIRKGVEVRLYYSKTSAMIYMP